MINNEVQSLSTFKVLKKNDVIFEIFFSDLFQQLYLIFRI